MIKDTYPIFIRLPDMFTGNRDLELTKASMLADAAREKGFDVAVIIDYFMTDPYHGCPPHVNPLTGNIVKNKRSRAAGLGYYPFSWREGWVKAQTAVANIIDVIRPDYLQQGVNATELNWKYVLPTNKLYWGYNDVMGLFMHARNEMGGWEGTYVVSGWYNHTLKKAREIFGSAITDEDLINRCTLDLPPDDIDDDDDGAVPPPPVDFAMLAARLAALEVIVAKIINFLAAIKNELKTWEYDAEA
jgi:hypothetical protein